MIFCAVVLIVFPIAMSSMTGEITATDWVYRHAPWIDRYLHGDFTPLVEYLPGFHFLMMPFVLLLGDNIGYMQIVFSVLSTFGILYMVFKTDNENAVLYSAMLLASSIAFVMFAGSLMPQALDYFLFPLAIVFYSKKRVKSCVAVLLLDFAMHGTGFIFLGILTLHSFIVKKYKFCATLVCVLFLLSPIFSYYMFGISPDQSFFYDYEAQKIWESQYLWPPWNFFIYSGIMTWILLPYALWKSRNKFTEMQLLYVLWIAAFLPFLVFELGIWRMVSYQIVPLSLLVASIISKDINKDKEIGKTIKEAIEGLW